MSFKNLLLIIFIVFLCGANCGTTRGSSSYSEPKKLIGLFQDNDAGFFALQKYIPLIETVRIKSQQDAVAHDVIRSLVIQDYYVSLMYEKFRNAENLASFARSFNELVNTLNAQYRQAWQTYSQELACQQAFGNSYNNAFKPCLRWLVNIHNLINQIVECAQDSQLDHTLEKKSLSFESLSSMDKQYSAREIKTYEKLASKIKLLFEGLDYARNQSRNCCNFLKAYLIGYAKFKPYLSGILLACLQNYEPAYTNQLFQKILDQNTALIESGDHLVTVLSSLKSAAQTQENLAANVEDFSKDKYVPHFQDDLAVINQKTNAFLKFADDENNKIFNVMKQNLEKILIEKATVCHSHTGNASLRLVDGGAKFCLHPHDAKKSSSNNDASKEIRKQLRSSFLLPSQGNDIIFDTKFRHFFGAQESSNPLSCGIGGGHGVIVLCDGNTSNPTYKLILQPQAKVTPKGDKIPLIEGIVDLLPVEIEYNNRKKTTTSYLFYKEADAYDFIVTLDWAILNSEYMSKYLSSQGINVSTKLLPSEIALFQVSLIGETAFLELKDEEVQGDYCFRLKQIYLITHNNSISGSKKRSLYAMEILLQKDSTPEFIHETVFPLLSAGHINFCDLNNICNPGDTGILDKAHDQIKIQEIIQEALKCFGSRIKDELEFSATTSNRNPSQIERCNGIIQQSYVIDKQKKNLVYIDRAHEFFMNSDLDKFVNMCRESHVQDVCSVYKDQKLINPSAFQCILEPTMYCLSTESSEIIHLWFRYCSDNNYYEVSFPAKNCDPQLKQLINLHVAHCVLEARQKEQPQNAHAIQQLQQPQTAKQQKKQQLKQIKLQQKSQQLQQLCDKPLIINGKEYKTLQEVEADITPLLNDFLHKVT